MKIKFNENESYEVELGEEISVTEFLGLLERFNKIAKLINQDVLIASKPIYSKPHVIKRKKAIALMPLEIRYKRRDEYDKLLSNDANVYELWWHYYNDDNFLKWAEEKGYGNIIRSKKDFNSGKIWAVRAKLGIKQENINKLFEKYGTKKEK